jgi:hypothetical protein
VIVFDIVEQGGDVALADRGEFPALLRRQHMNIKQPLDLRTRAQALGLDVSVATAIAGSRSEFWSPRPNRFSSTK